MLDAEAARISLFFPPDKFANSISFRNPPIDRVFSPVEPEVPLADGSIAFAPSIPSHLSGRGVTRPIPLVQLSRTGVISDTFALLDIQNLWVIIRNPAAPHLGEIYRLHPMMDFPLWDVAADGDRLIVVRRLAARQSPSHFNVTVISAATDTLWTRSYRYAPQRVADRASDSIYVNIAESGAKYFQSEAAAERIWNNLASPGGGSRRLCRVECT